MVIILHNPLSKNKKSKRATKKLVDHYKAHKTPFRLKSVLKIDDVNEYLTKRQDVEKIILIGGDGTINGFVNRIYDHLPLPYPIYLHKGGSGNDFLRTLVKERPTEVPVMKLTHNGETQYFMNGTGMGMDALIGMKVDRSPNKSQSRYFFATLSTFVSYKPSTLTVTLDGETKTFEKAYFITANNGQYFGGGMQISPSATLKDDALDVVLVHGINKLKLFFIFTTIYKGKHVNYTKYVYHQKARHVKAFFPQGEVNQCDGECFENTTLMEATASGKTISFIPFEK